MDAVSLQPGRAVYIQWEDSATVDGWRSSPQVDYGTITSVGFVVETDEKGLVLSTSLNDQFTCICPLSIPWSCVVKCIELEPQWGKSYEGHNCVDEILNISSSGMPKISEEDRTITEEYEKICQQMQGS